jgi:hypothetical protein
MNTFVSPLLRKARIRKQKANRSPFAQNSFALGSDQETFQGLKPANLCPSRNYLSLSPGNLASLNVGSIAKEMNAANKNELISSQNDESPRCGLGPGGALRFIAPPLPRKGSGGDTSHGPD